MQAEDRPRKGRPSRGSSKLTRSGTYLRSNPAIPVAVAVPFKLLNLFLLSGSMDGT